MNGFSFSDCKIIVVYNNCGVRSKRQSRLRVLSDDLLLKVGRFYLTLIRNEGLENLDIFIWNLG